jgi:hypothetical protein
MKYSVLNIIYIKAEQIEGQPPAPMREFSYQVHDLTDGKHLKASLEEHARIYRNVLKKAILTDYEAQEHVKKIEDVSWGGENELDYRESI